MALVLADRVQQTGTANTTVSFTLSGSVTGYQSFAVVGNGNTTYYAATDASGNWEVGIGTYSTTGPTLTRTTILSSSNSGSAVTFSGSVNVFVTYPSEKAVNLDGSGNVSALGTVSSGVWQGTAVSITYGGTGQATAAAGFNALSPITSTGDLIIGNGTNSATRLPIGSNNYVLTSNGTTASWQPSSGGGGGISWQSVQTSNFSATSGNAYPVNTTSGAITVTLPASPVAGNYVQFTDYAGTFATNNLTINPNGKKINAQAVNGVLALNRESVALVYIDSTQGWIAYSGFNDSSILPNYTASYLIVAGGGGGGRYYSGGGGAGGLISGSGTLVSGTTYSIVVGAGGSGNVSSSPGPGSQGSSSSFFGLTAIGGGYGNGTNSGSANGGSGGSGGGGGGPGGTASGGSGTSGQGNSGGNSSSSGGAGGGGAGATGGSYPSGSGAGGVGLSSSITGSATYYAGGGGGSFDSAQGAGGNGGGGKGATNSLTATAGTANTGGGGGGGSFASSTVNYGASGGSGVVIISVPTANYSAITTGSPTVTTSGSNTILTFTSSGSYTA